MTFESLLEAVEEADLNRLRSGLLENPNLVNKVEAEHGWTMLHRACRLGWLNGAQLLLDHGADANARDLKRFTPLHDAACSYGQVCVVRLLDLAGAKINARNAYWQSPIMLAVETSNLKTFSYFLGKGADLRFRDRQGRNLRDAAIYQLESVPKARKYANQREELSQILDCLSLT